jgi:hypothetical protein
LSARIDKIIQHHEERAGEILAQVQGMPRTGWDIASRITWRVATWQEMDAATRQAAYMETSAHLKYLVGKGALRLENGPPGLLIDEMRVLRGENSSEEAVLVGTGRLGRSTLEADWLPEAGLKIIAAFDADPRQEGRAAGGLKVQPMESLAEVVNQTGVKRAILAVPPPYAQGVADRLVNSGIDKILSYGSTGLNLPDHVSVRVVDALLAFQSATVYQRA